MFYSLPIEVQFDVLKCLNFNQVSSFKQTNFYLHNLINKYENELARMKFGRLEIGAYDLIASRKIGFTIIVPEFRKFKLDPVPVKISVPVKQLVTSEFILNRQLLKKWKAAIAESIPLYLHDSEHYREGAEFSICLGGPNYLLKLPNIPKNIEEMFIVRSGLKQLFKCAFKEGRFHYTIFNPQMINLLFDDDKTISPQFNIQKPRFFFENNSFNNFLKFALNHFANSKILHLNFGLVNNLEEYTNILFNILINEGKFPKVYFYCPELTKLCDLIIEYMATSKDCSKMVSYIILDEIDYPNSKLKKLAENVEIYDDSSIECQIANIYNPKVRFAFAHFYRLITIERM